MSCVNILIRREISDSFLVVKDLYTYFKTLKHECITWLSKKSEGITSRGNFMVIGNWNHDFCSG